MINPVKERFTLRDYFKENWLLIVLSYSIIIVGIVFCVYDQLESGFNWGITGIMLFLLLIGGLAYYRAVLIVKRVNK